MKKMVLLMAIALLSGACAQLEGVGTISGVPVGSVIKAVNATARAARPVSDEEEYYVGRAVAARILASYKLVKDNELTRYVNLVGITIALHSDKPDTFGGYHFAVLDAQEINAFACPGGTIFITKGMIDALKTEDELAAVLAHEVAHINHRDGIGAITSARWTEAVSVIGTEAARQYGPAELNQLVSLFDGAIDDVFKTLVVNGYGRSQELDADTAALTYMTRAGYAPGALKSFLDTLVKQAKASEGGLMKTHPGTVERADHVKANMPEAKVSASSIDYRTRRFRDSAR